MTPSDTTKNDGRRDSNSRQAPDGGGFEANSGTFQDLTSKPFDVSGRVQSMRAELAEAIASLRPETDLGFEADDLAELGLGGPKPDDPRGNPDRNPDRDRDDARGGRPRVLDAFTRGRICELLGSGMSQRQVAAYVDCSRATLQREMKRNLEFAASIDQCMQLAELQPLMRIARAAQTDWRAAAWLVKHLRQRAEDDGTAQEILELLKRLDLNEQAENTESSAEPQAAGTKT
jgi:hypothetical protein